MSLDPRNTLSNPLNPSHCSMYNSDKDGCNCSTPQYRYIIELISEGNANPTVNAHDGKGSADTFLLAGIVICD